MALESLLARLKGDVSHVADVQTPVDASLQCNGTKTLNVTDVAGLNCVGTGATVVTANDIQPLQQSSAWAMGCTVETVATATFAIVTAANDSLDDGTTATDTVNTINPDRWCWPNGTAMNGVEIATFMARVARFTAKGLTHDVGEALADRLVIRDREPDDRRCCLECANLAGIGSWHCRNWRQAEVAIKAIDAALPVDLVCLLQRCNGFSAGAV